jgi:hypothetical protein
VDGGEARAEVAARAASEQHVQRAAARQSIEDFRCLLFVHGQEELAPDALLRDRVQRPAFDRGAHQLRGLRIELEAEALREPDGAEDPRGIVDEALVVQDAHDARVEVALPVSGVVHRAGHEVDRDGVDREVAAEEVVLQAARGHARERARLPVTLLARGGDVDLREIVRRDLVGQELRERAQAAVDAFGERAGEGRAAGLEREINVY